MDDNRKVVRDFILEEFLPGESPDELTDSTSLIEGGIIDSIGMLKLVSFLEEDLNILIEAHEISGDNFEDIDRIVHFVASKKI